MPSKRAAAMSRINFERRLANYVDFIAAPVDEPEPIHHLTTQGADAIAAG
jgi:hypothetical protein